MKKLLSVVLAGAMMASLTACGGGAAQTTPAETTVEETTRKAPETLGETLLFDFELCFTFFAFDCVLFSSFA